MGEYLNINQVAEELKVTLSTVYKLIDHPDPLKKLEPVNPESYRGEGGYRFRKEDVERIKPLYISKDLTTTQAAARIGRSKTFLQNLMRNGELSYYEAYFRGKNTFFIKEEDLLEYEQSKPSNVKSNTLYDKKTGAFLFQPYLNKENGRIARIMEMERISPMKIKAKMIDEGGKGISYEEAIATWKPLIQLERKESNSAYGYACFNFPIPTFLDSMIYTIIEQFYQHVGPANMRISKEEASLVVKVKKCVLKGISPLTYPDFIDKLKLYIRSGEIISEGEDTVINTCFSPITFYLQESRKSLILKQASEKGMTIQEWLEDHFNNYEWGEGV
ncbi:helix-turn-helix domain-containing protein [Paenibacillus sp. FSL R5-0914]|uniref:helix-turn-helix domain-containing protein n=1 Tax=Paenibacillus sp. FSL R5-0914 TaxID=2921665 RepID=UPI0030FCBA35